MLLRLFAITTKEVRQLARDRLTFGMIIGIPLMQILLFGYAINFDVRDLNAAVVDEAKTSHSRALVADLQATGVIVLRPPSPSLPDLRQRMESGEISIGIVICQNCCHLLAPSTSAASYSDFGIDCSPARKNRKL